MFVVSYAFVYVSGVFYKISITVLCIVLWFFVKVLFSVIKMCLTFSKKISKNNKWLLNITTVICKDFAYYWNGF
jgi:predicted membrane protein